MTDSLKKSNLLSKCLYITRVNPCSFIDLTTTHDAVYVDKLYKLATEFDDEGNHHDVISNKADKTFKFSKDFVNVYYNKNSLLSCRVSVGSCITMIKHLLSDSNDNQYGVALVRPPGIVPFLSVCYV